MGSRRFSSRSLSLVALVVLLANVLGLALPTGARADGVVVVEPPGCDVACSEPVLIADQLKIRHHRVDVTIADQVATTRIDQVFHNPNDWIAEGTYLFPVPVDATIGEFVMWVDGEPVEAKLLDAAEARQIYDDVVRRLRDPALLEYAGRDAIQARIFPIPPGEDRRIEIEYAQVLPVEQGLTHYVYPLNTERFSAEPLEQVSVRVAVTSRDPVRAVYSPSHDIAVDRVDEHRFVAGYEEAGVLPATDFELFYSVSPDAIGANLISHYDPVADEGYFMLLAAPGIETDAEVIAKDVVIVLDTSGSMEGEKLAQAKTAVTYVLDHLNSKDRFNVVEFSTGAREYDRSLLDARAAEDAIAWVERLEATGGTDINLALLNAMAMVEPERPTLVLFLTDGLPTEGETDVARILDNVATTAPDNVRLFAFGVGDDVDTVLLDSLAQAHHGASSYVRPGQAIDEAVSGFYAGVSAPVLTDLELDFGEVHVEELYPAPLPDLFAGTQLVVLGRYRDGGPATVSLSGTVSGRSQTFTYPDQRFGDGRRGGADNGNVFLPRLWATRKIGYLLNQIRLNGEREEWVSAIVDLSVRFGVVTPYTSYLITEDDILTRDGREAAVDEEQDRLEEAPPQTTGAQAVEAADTSGDMAAADAAPVPSADYAEAIRVIGSRAFVWQDGVWVETTFDPSRMTATPVQFASDDYFKLLETHPDLGPAFALGSRVIALSQGQAFEITLDPTPPST